MENLTIIKKRNNNDKTSQLTFRWSKNNIVVNLKNKDDIDVSYNGTEFKTNSVNIAAYIQIIRNILDELNLIKEGVEK